MEEKDLKELRELVEFLKSSAVAEFEMERPNLKVGLKFVGAAAPASAGIDPAQLAALLAASRSAAPTSAPAAAPTPAAAAAPTVVDPHEGAHIVKSPIVGTFYASPSPDAEPFVQTGDQVFVGQELCIIEAMKTMNPLESDAAGTIVKIYVQSGQAVEYGQPLFAIQ